MKKIIEWAELNPTRGRKIVLFSTVSVFLITTIILFGVAIYGHTMSPTITTLYVTFVGLMSAIYGFYTGTSSDKSGKLADKAADIIMTKLNDLDKDK